MRTLWGIPATIQFTQVQESTTTCTTETYTFQYKLTDQRWPPNVFPFHSDSSSMEGQTVLVIPVDGVHCLEGSLTISLRMRNFILSRVKGVTAKLPHVYCRTFVSRGGSWRGCPPRTFRILSSRRKNSDTDSIIASRE